MSCSVRTILLGLAMLTFAFAQTAQERNTAGEWPFRRECLGIPDDGRRAACHCLHDVWRADIDVLRGDRKGDNLFANSVVALTRRPESISGISRRSITISGTTTSRPRPA
jgi:hypothetical protein